MSSEEFKNYTEESSQGLNCTVTKEYQEQEKDSFPRKSTLSGYPIPVVSPEDIHTNNTIQNEQVVFFMYLGIYISVYTNIYICTYI